MTEYQEKQWKIFICNHFLPVTLKPAIKKVVSGKIEFELSWVMQEDDKVIQ